jgi:hypothetical protein
MKEPVLFSKSAQVLLRYKLAITYRQALFLHVVVAVIAPLVVRTCVTSVLEP